MQALSRSRTLKPAEPGRAGRFGFEYKRNGTRCLFACFNVATGRVLGHCTRRRKRSDFFSFMDMVASVYRQRRVHVVLDNLNTHRNTTRGTFVTEWNRRHGNRFVLAMSDIRECHAVVVCTDGSGRPTGRARRGLGRRCTIAAGRQGSTRPRRVRPGFRRAPPAGRGRRGPATRERSCHGGGGCPPRRRAPGGPSGRSVTHSRPPGAGRRASPGDVRAAGRGRACTQDPRRGRSRRARGEPALPARRPRRHGRAARRRPLRCRESVERRLSNIGRSLCLSLHAHQRLVAQPGRALVRDCQPPDSASW